MPGTPVVPRILVGDDEIQICRLVQDVLKITGYPIETTTDGREILKKHAESGYSLIILDTILTNLSGLEVVTKLRDRGDSVPIILMSGPMKEPDRVESFAFTYRVDVLRKPFGVGDLRSAVERALRASQPEASA